MCHICDTKPAKLRTKAAAIALKLPTGRDKPATHEALIDSVYRLALQLPTLTKADRDLLTSIKLTYGAGPDGVRGVTYYKLWTKNAPKPRKGAEPKPTQVIPFVAICATGQSDHIQVIGTTLHELGHVIAGFEAAHGKAWIEACARLGLIGIKAAGTEYGPENFTTDHGFRKALLALPKPKDGAPVNAFGGGLGGLVLPPGLSLPPMRIKPCTAGYGAKGGKSRGKGSGSRLLKYSCGCTIVRASAGADFKATCGKCGETFKV
jgi:hypothetical protein